MPTENRQVGEFSFYTVRSSFLINGKWLCGRLDMQVPGCNPGEVGSIPARASKGNTMENYALAWSFLIFVSYIIYVVKNFGILPSISDSFYKHKNRVLFAAFIWLTVVPLAYIGMESVWMQAGAGFLCFVGVATNFKKRGITILDEYGNSFRKQKNTVERFFHMYGAMLGFSFAFMAMVFTFHIWSPLIIMASFIIIANLLKIKNRIFWIEIVGFLLLIIGFFIKINLEY